MKAFATDAYTWFPLIETSNIQSLDTECSFHIRIFLKEVSEKVDTSTEGDILEHAKIYKIPKNDYEDAVNNAAVNLAKMNPGLLLERGIVLHIPGIQLNLKGVLTLMTGELLNLNHCEVRTTFNTIFNTTRHSILSLRSTMQYYSYFLCL